MLKNVPFPGVLISIVVIIALFLVLGTQFQGPGLTDYEYRIAGVCSLNRNSAFVVYIACDGIDKRIDAEVVQVGWNDKFLVAITHPVTKRKYPDISDNSYTEPDESMTYWWILDLSNKQAYGPMSEQDFNLEKAKLGMPDIQLISTDEAKVKGTWLYGDGRSS